MKKLLMFGVFGDFQMQATGQAIGLWGFYLFDIIKLTL